MCGHHGHDWPPVITAAAPTAWVNVLFANAHQRIGAHDKTDRCWADHRVQDLDHDGPVAKRLGGGASPSPSSFPSAG